MCFGLGLGPSFFESASFFASRLYWVTTFRWFLYSMWFLEFGFWTHFRKSPSRLTIAFFIALVIHEYYSFLRTTSFSGANLPIHSIIFWHSIWARISVHDVDWIVLGFWSSRTRTFFALSPFKFYSFLTFFLSSSFLYDLRGVRGIDDATVKWSLIVVSIVCVHSSSPAIQWAKQLFVVGVTLDDRVFCILQSYELRRFP